MDPYDKLERLTSVVAADAMAISKAILEEIQRESDTVMQNAENECLNDTFRFVKKEIGNIRADTGRRISKRVMEHKRALGIRREQMADDVTRKVRERLEDYIHTTAYLEDMKGLLRQALGLFGSADVTVYLCPGDADLIPALTETARAYSAELGPDAHGRVGMHVSFREGSFSLGGMMASCVSTRRQIDASYDTKLEELREHFAEMFGLELAN